LSSDDPTSSASFPERAKCTAISKVAGLAIYGSCGSEDIPVRARASLFIVLTAVVLTMLPRFAEAGPCSSDIADLETAIRLFGGNPPARQEQQSADAQPKHQPAPDLARRRQVQFSATMARAKRLDTHGDRFGCIGALNAARHMYVLVARQ
jgi:hypothetical protein